MNAMTIKPLAAMIMASMFLLWGCVKEVQQPVPEQEDLHEIVFHAGWDAEAKTVLQEDGSVFWSPGDEICLFIDGSGYYKLTSTNSEPTAKADFVGQIGECPLGTSYVAVYPYHSFINGAISIWESTMAMTIPNSQVAQEGNFDASSFVSVAESDNETLYFRNVCGGIKFSVANEGIEKITIKANANEIIAGSLVLSRPSLEVHKGVVVGDNWSSSLEIFAPDNGTFHPGSYYYAVIPAQEYERGFTISYHKAKELAIFEDYSDITIKRSTFKRLYNKDAELQFKPVYDKKAMLPTNLLPDGVDKTTITEAHFYVNTDKVTNAIIDPGNDEYEPVYFEQEGSVVNYYTKGEVYILTYADSMFEGWKSLKTLDLSTFNTDNVYSFGGMFMDCCNLEEVDLSSFSTEKSMGFPHMFSGCSSLISLDLSNFDTSNATSLYAMFKDCRNLRTLDVSNFKTSKVKEFDYMFFRCINLTSVDVSGFDMSSAESTGEMFYECHSLGDIDTHQWKSSNIKYMPEMFHGCRSITSLDLSGINLSNVENVQGMFGRCNSLQNIKFSDTKTAPLVSWGIEGLFSECSKLKHADMSHYDTSNVTNMQLMFLRCYDLESIDFGDMNTSNVTNMLWMFNGCSSLKKLDLSGFDTRSLTNMERMFSSCSSLRELDLSNWNTSQVVDMMYAFEGCKNLERLDISSFTSESLQQVWGLFAMTNKLSAIDMGDFDLTNLSSQSVAYKTGSLTPHCYVRCSHATRSALEQTAQDFSNVVWITDGSPLPADISSRDESLYYSSDFSMDKKVRVVQKASKGNGIDIVLMGDCYSDRMIAAGDYDRDMERTINSIFKHEPFKSFKDMFNIYIIYAVSENEIVGKSTVFGSHPDRAENGGSIGADYISNIYAYSHAASGKGDQREIVTIVVFNSEINDGAVRHFISTSAEGEVFDYHNDLNWDDYHGGENIAFLSGPTTSGYEETVIHELGHAFGNLADEYFSEGEISEYAKNDLLHIFPYGMWKNIDVTGDSNLVKWRHFLSDSRYINTGVGVYEGGNLYAKGIWRPSANSIMRGMTGQFNAPSREAIYYRIHKLAYGKNWPYDYEAFVQWDQKNIEADKAAMLAPRASQRKASSISVRKPFFNISKGYGSKGQEGTVIIMD